MTLVRFGCLAAIAIVVWAIVAIPVAIALTNVMPADSALAAALFGGGTGAYLTIRRLRHRLVPAAPTESIADSDQLAPEPLDRVHPSAGSIDQAHVASTPDIASNALALEAERALALSRRPAVEAVTAAATPRTMWSMRLVGALVGILITFLVFVPAGAPDGGEVTFALSLFTIIGGLTIGSGLRNLGSPRMSLAGEVIFGLGIGAAVGFAWLFIIPLI